MKAIIQRVSKANVKVNEKSINETYPNFQNSMPLINQNNV